MLFNICLYFQHGFRTQIGLDQLLMHLVLTCTEQEFSFRFGNYRICHFILGVFWLCAIPSSVVNVVVACNKDTAKVPTAEAVVRPFAGTVFVFLASWTWMTLSPTHIMEHSPRLFLLCGGTLAANITVSSVLVAACAHSSSAVVYFCPCV